MGSLSGQLRVTDRLGVRGRPPAGVWLAVLLGAGFASLVFAVAAPISNQAPVRLDKILSGVVLAMSLGTFVFARRLPQPVLLAEAVLTVLINDLVVVNSVTRAGAMADAMTYQWLTIYVGMFFPALALPFAGFEVGTFGLSLIAGGLPRMLACWFLVGVTTVVAGMVVAHMSRALRRQIATDPLTGALNRAGLEAAARRALGRARRHSNELAVAVIDFDDFKQVNDRHGHASGDRLLTEATTAWHRTLRQEDVLARLGGDEFVLLMPGASPEQAAAVLERLRASHPAAWSAGIASWRQGENLEQCLARADKALYAAKVSAQRAAEPATSRRDVSADTPPPPAAQAAAVAPAAG